MGSCPSKRDGKHICINFFNRPTQLHQDYMTYQDLTADLNDLDLLDIYSSNDDVFDLYFDDDTNTANNKYISLGSNCVKRT
jgi:hypothetical protein